MSISTRVPVLVAFVLCLAACGSGHTTDPAALDTHQPTVTESTTSVPVTTAPTTTAPEVLALVGLGFCEQLSAYDEAVDRSGLFDADSVPPDAGELEAQWVTYLELSDRLLDAAPTELRSDLERQQAPVRALAALYERIDWDYGRLETDINSALELAELGTVEESTEIIAAADRVDWWIVANCEHALDGSLVDD